MDKTWKESYDQLSKEAYEEIRHGNFRTALDLFTLARKLAEGAGDQLEIDRAVCNLSNTELSLGNFQTAEQGLREILLRCSDHHLLFIASANLASSLSRQGRMTRALFYSKKALGESAFLEPHWKALSRNRLANMYLMQSYFQEAIAEYRAALEIARQAGIAEQWPTEHYLDNLGYCLVLTQEYRGGILHIHEALGLARGRRNQRCVTECFQDLSFAYMQLRSLRKAELYGRRALGLALRKQYTDIIKTCYYLLGEIHYLQGNERESDFYFGKLQEFYPDISCLAEFLKTFDVSKILNFKNPS
ncbi:MAG TPA: tetratricopeptide repeat protein [Candidatus Polarisedimenticolia bacterium]|nr:tetratricopeptide repeat protein [Candidatus Polarisedimenticolia bacterium]